jgi:hypothetical protein
MISDFMYLCGLRTRDTQLSTDVSRQAWGQVTKRDFSLFLHKSDHNCQVSYRFSFFSNFKNQTLKPQTPNNNHHTSLSYVIVSLRHEAASCIVDESLASAKSNPGLRVSSLD